MCAGVVLLCASLGGLVAVMRASRECLREDSAASSARSSPRTGYKQRAHGAAPRPRPVAGPSTVFARTPLLMPPTTTSATTSAASAVAAATAVRGQQLQAGLGQQMGTQSEQIPSRYRRANGLLGSASPLLVFAHAAAHNAHSHSARAHRALVHQPHSESHSRQQTGAQANGSELLHSQSESRLQPVGVSAGRVGAAAVARVLLAHSRNPEAADSAGSSGGRSGTTRSSVGERERERGHTCARSHTRKSAAASPPSSRVSLGVPATAVTFGARLAGHSLRRGMSTAGTSDSVRALMESSWHSSRARSSRTGSQSGSRSRSGDAELDAEGDEDGDKQNVYVETERERATRQQRQRTREARREEERSRTSQRVSADCTKFTSQMRTQSHRYSRLPRSLSSETHSRRSK